MSSPPPETETHEVTLSREEQWVVHHVLATLVDDALDDDETPPAWILEVFETIESEDEPETFTSRQVRRLSEELCEYLEEEETPQRDYVHGSAVLETLEDELGSPA
ncbi:DUF7853 family protein [Natrarchaeobius oligotrophus]|uniref:Uncharacterized protein n=1 Tax=Natrarchaeobius chitinivorans TaxID=1679083 RepID=A0A3N6MVE9_NATCH|nr:hypothetical protein [Natrarchaeobius chitinivorans]RQH00302.1 hypothetical protein EA472_10580 [Natrarchaeobius chitinivorans]